MSGFDQENVDPNNMYTLLEGVDEHGHRQLGPYAQAVVNGRPFDSAGFAADLAAAEATAAFMRRQLQLGRALKGKVMRAGRARRVAREERAAREARAARRPLESVPAPQPEAAPALPGTKRGRNAAADAAPPQRTTRRARVDAEAVDADVAAGVEAAQAVLARFKDFAGGLAPLAAAAYWAAAGEAAAKFAEKKPNQVAAAAFIDTILINAPVTGTDKYTKYGDMVKLKDAIMGAILRLPASTREHRRMWQGLLVVLIAAYRQTGVPWVPLPTYSIDERVTLGRLKIDAFACEARLPAKLEAKDVPVMRARLFAYIMVIGVEAFETMFKDYVVKHCVKVASCIVDTKKTVSLVGSAAETGDTYVRQRDKSESVMKQNGHYVRMKIGYPTPDVKAKMDACLESLGLSCAKVPQNGQLEPLLHQAAIMLATLKTYPDMLKGIPKDPIAATHFFRLLFDKMSESSHMCGQPRCVGSHVPPPKVPEKPKRGTVPGLQSPHVMLEQKAINNDRITCDANNTSLGRHTDLERALTNKPDLPTTDCLCCKKHYPGCRYPNDSDDFDNPQGVAGACLEGWTNIKLGGTTVTVNNPFEDAPPATYEDVDALLASSVLYLQTESLLRDFDIGGRVRSQEEVQRLHILRAAALANAARGGGGETGEDGV